MATCRCRDATTWLALLGLAALSTALAYIVFFQILRRSGSTNVMLVTLLIPVTAILLGYLVLGESISLREIIGALVIGSALLVIDGRVLNLVSAARFPFRKPAGKPAAVALAAVPGRVDRAVVGHQQHHVEAPGAAQRIDRLAGRLRDRDRRH